MRAMHFEPAFVDDSFAQLMRRQLTFTTRSTELCVALPPVEGVPSGDHEGVRIVKR